MALNIKRSRVEELARRSADLREVSITDAVQAALEREVVKLEKARDPRTAQIMTEIRKLQGPVPQRAAALQGP